MASQGDSFLPKNVMWRLSQLSLGRVHGLQHPWVATCRPSHHLLPRLQCHNPPFITKSSLTLSSFACAFACCTNDEIKGEADPFCLCSSHGGSL
jgi:hypothetical protein